MTSFADTPSESLTLVSSRIAERSPDSDASGALRCGQVLGARYRLGNQLGAGGMGIVYEGRHIALGCPVAIKVIRSELAAQRGPLSLFMHEARATAKLRGEHTVRILDLGELESGAPFLVMERLEGSDLAKLIGDTGGLQVEVAVDYVMHACAGLAVAHSVGLIHRDIKPSNLFVDRRGSERGRVKVLDFGASKWLWSDPQEAYEAADTTEGGGVGSPAYVSPEQLENSCEVDQRSDVWSLGAVLFELVTGRVAFAAGNLDYGFHRNHFEATANLRGANVGSGLERVIRHCLEKDRSRRFPSVEELSFALQPFCTARLGGRAPARESSTDWR